jgi:predicted CXXCH cytochrome family protein
MPRHRWWAWGATALALAVGATAALRPARADPPKKGALDADFAPGYVGSDACAPCHEAQYKPWKETLHSRMEQPATPSSVIGQFTREGHVVKAEAAGKKIVMLRDGDRFFIQAPDAAGKPQRYPIERTIGNRYKQRYLTKFPDGSWRTLPVQWFEKDQRFVEWRSSASHKPGSGSFWADDAWQWQLKCAGCHTTGLDLGYDPEEKTYATRWKELAIGCEACHGPGEAHVKAKGGKGNIVCPSKLSHSQQLDACGKCHSRGTAGPEHGAPKGLPGRLAYPYNMVPGTKLADVYVQYEPADHPKDFWKDESAKNHHQQWNDYARSEMLAHGGPKSPTCTTCHDPHRADALRATIDDNKLCNDCHTAYRDPAALAAHTGHGSDPIANAGARCVECHMPRIVEHAGSVRLRSHTYWGPNPKRSRELGTPDACLLCHTDKDSDWSEAATLKIWGGGAVTPGAK